VSGLRVIALGGNALLRKGERGTAAEQRANLASTFAAIAPLLREGGVVLTHGNGPQVGNELLRHELGAAEAPPLPLWVAVGQTQAEVGALAAAELAAVAGRPAAVLLTRVSVAADDPAFANPTKPVGPFYSEEQARELERERGWALVEDAGRGWRRVVASPRPLEILELESIRALLASGAVTVAVGGGGIPVVQRDGRVDGVDAVIDKDHASAVLAVGLGADELLILTQVPSVFRGFGTPDEEAVAELRPDRDEGILAELPAGSMRPKVEAAFAFVRATGGRARITSAEAFAENDEAGTVVVPASAP
jgi:carbamate kinase